jgi:RNA polymerase sigma-70 factor (ECF subfamily)
VIALTFDSDNDIIREYVETRSEIAATAFVRKYQKFVYSTALRYLQSYDAADDASQEVFIKVFMSISRFRGDSSVKTWLYKITVNTCTNIMRKKKIKFWEKQQSIDEYLELPSGEHTPDKQYENKEYEKNFLKMLSKLPEKQREVFSLRYFDELPYEEISKMVGTTVGGLKANYYQATKKIADLLQKEIKI